MTERVGQSFGNYQLLRLLGSGAFAEVYLAEHRYLEIPAAIKVLHVRMEPDTHEQFRREAHTIAHLQNPHIIRVYDFGFQDLIPYLVMEYTPNGTLRTRHPKGTRLELAQIILYLKQIAPALDYAHQQRVIHRDVKPENMLLSANDEVILSDFGLAVVQQSLDSLATQSQAGTPGYMAPEQIEGHPCAASDQYALGVVVYEWLCGARPFEGTLTEVMVQHLTMPPPPLHEKGATNPEELEHVVLRALAKDPKARFASVQDFAEVLQQVCEATQSLMLRASSERLSPEQIPPPDILPAPRHEPSLQDQARSFSTTQPLVHTHQHTADREASEALEMLPSAARIHASSQHPGVAVSRTNRQRFLRKVRAFWITGVFEHSLHGAALIALGLEEQPDAVANPWQLVLQHPAGAPRSLPAGTRITEVYDRAEGELLILGAPGSGKSTLLLELARDLLSRAEQDEQHPLLAVFNLSSWASQQQPLADWLVEELNSTYQVPRKLGQAWVEADQILPLLDGLDEVAPQDRTACIECINSYRGEHGFLPMVVCSRSADYLSQAARVRLGSAVAVQPLTDQQVGDYLARGGEALWALQVSLHQDAALRELTSTPLMLSILTLTYHDMPVEDLLRGGIAPTRQQIFAHYVQRMLRQRGTAMRYTAEQTRHWLAFLAQQLKQHNQTIFYIEHLQPGWLTGERMHRIYDRWALRFPAILMGMLVTLAIYLLLVPTFIPSLLALALFLAPIMVLGGFLGWLLGRGGAPIG
jgi:serine/threonine protein kinase/DNA polymerase III delta prime subunit